MENLKVFNPLPFDNESWISTWDEKWTTENLPDGLYYVVEDPRNLENQYNCHIAILKDNLWYGEERLDYWPYVQPVKFPD